MLQTTDFTGYYKIAQDQNTAAILADYIAKYEKQYLVELFGVELYDLFIADLDSNVPQSSRFLTVFNALNYSDSGESTFYPIGFNGRGCFSDNTPEPYVPQYSEGILKMLKGFIYFEFVNEYGYMVSQTGVVQNMNENSEALPGAKHLGLIESRYNDSVHSFTVIRNYMKANPDLYPEYDGIEKHTSHWGGAF